MKRLLLIVSFMLAFGITGVAQTPFPVRLPIGTIERIDEWARTNITMVSVLIRYDDTYEEILFDLTPFSRETDFVEEFIPRLITEKLKVLENISGTNALRPFRITYGLLDNSAFMLYSGVSIFHLQMVDGSYVVPPEVVEGWQMTPGYSRSIRLPIPGIVKARLFVRNGSVVVFDETIDGRHNTSTNQYWVLSRAFGDLTFPTELITSGYQGELTIWVNQGGLKTATYDIPTGVRTLPIHLAARHYYDGTIRLTFTGGAGRTVELYSFNSIGGPKTLKATVSLDSDGNGSFIVDPAAEGSAEMEMFSVSYIGETQ